MKIELWSIGKTKADYLKEGIDLYTSRLKHYTNFELRAFDDVKNASKLSVELLKEKEAKMIIEKLPSDASLILLDEQGKMLHSVGFSKFLGDHMNYSGKPMIFLVGGAFGFHSSLYSKADHKISLSKMTFSHQMVRLFFVEQLYRAFTILNNEKYHNQ
jgi:23S rRNA (pseudouridine1915-N3)-methyltransferase